MVIGAEHIALVVATLAVGTAVWKGGRQARETEQNTDDIKVLWEKHDQLMAKMDDQQKQMNVYHSQRLENDSRILSELAAMRVEMRHHRDTL